MANVRHKVTDLKVAVLKWQGYSNTEISHQLGMALMTVNNILGSPEIVKLFAEYRAGTLSTMVDVQQQLQAIAPEMVNLKLQIVRNENIDVAVRSRSATELLQMAGHVPTKHMVLEHVDVVADKYATMTEEDLKAELSKELSDPRIGTIPLTADKDTVH